MLENNGFSLSIILSAKNWKIIWIFPPQPSQLLSSNFVSHFDGSLLFEVTLFLYSSGKRKYGKCGILSQFFPFRRYMSIWVEQIPDYGIQIHGGEYIRAFFFLLLWRIFLLFICQDGNAEFFSLFTKVYWFFMNKIRASSVFSTWIAKEEPKRKTALKKLKINHEK